MNRAYQIFLLWVGFVALKSNPLAAALEPMRISIQKSQARFKRIRNPHGPDEGVGEFFMLVHITATSREIYIPTSIASGKKPTGFVYQIEGTAKGSISTTHISCGGEGITQVTLGTIVYTKIPQGMTAEFRILIEMRGQMEKEYKIGINRIQYKYTPSDARYQKYVTDLSSKNLRFH